MLDPLPSTGLPDWRDVIQSMMTLYMHRRFRIPKCGSALQMKLALQNTVYSSFFPDYERQMREWKRRESTSLLQEVESLGAACMDAGRFPAKNMTGPVELYDASWLKGWYDVWKEPPASLRLLRSVQPRTTNLAHMRILVAEAQETEGMRSQAPPHIDLSCYVTLQTMINTFRMEGIEECLASTEPPPLCEALEK
jgi:hypothetical protein